VSCLCYSELFSCPCCEVIESFCGSITFHFYAITYTTKLVFTTNILTADLLTGNVSRQSVFLFNRAV